jgi:hypothetical protein
VEQSPLPFDTKPYCPGPYRAVTALVSTTSYYRKPCFTASGKKVHA